MAANTNLLKAEIRRSILSAPKFIPIMGERANMKPPIGCSINEKMRVMIP